MPGMSGVKVHTWSQMNVKEWQSLKLLEPCLGQLFESSNTSLRRSQTFSSRDPYIPLTVESTINAWN
eukprot:m.130754 g.130754  ORF g.130754 m.130754 type:complete len:67 (-) comp14608_c0_seq1:28-228(-)